MLTCRLQHKRRGINQNLERVAYYKCYPRRLDQSRAAELIEYLRTKNGVLKEAFGKNRILLPTTSADGWPSADKRGGQQKGTGVFSIFTLLIDHCASPGDLRMTK